MPPKSDEFLSAIYQYMQVYIGRGYNITEAAGHVSRTLENDGATGVRPNTLRRLFNELSRQYTTSSDKPSSGSESIMEQFDAPVKTFRVESPMRISADSAIVWGDVHIPHIHKQTEELMMAVARANGIRKLVIGGDLLNQDSLSTHPATAAPFPLSEEIAIARQFLKRWRSHFTEGIYCFAGNHDERAAKATGGQVTFRLMMNSVGFEDHEISSNRYAYLYSRDKHRTNHAYALTHDKSYSKIPGKAARDLSLAIRMNVIKFHEHHAAKIPNGDYVIINPGCAIDSAQVPYVTSELNTMPPMVNGFCVVHKGIAEPLVLHPTHYTDWEYWLSGKLTT